MFNGKIHYFYDHFNSFLYVYQAGSSSVAFLFILTVPAGHRPLGVILHHPSCRIAFTAHKNRCFPAKLPQILDRYSILLIIICCLAPTKSPKILRWTNLQNLPYFFADLRRSSQSNGLCGALSPSPAIPLPSIAGAVAAARWLCWWRWRRRPGWRRRLSGRETQPSCVMAEARGWGE